MSHVNELANMLRSPENILLIIPPRNKLLKSVLLLNLYLLVIVLFSFSILFVFLFITIPYFVIFFISIYKKWIAYKYSKILFFSFSAIVIILGNIFGSFIIEYLSKLFDYLTLIWTGIFTY